MQLNAPTAEADFARKLITLVAKINYEKNGPTSALTETAFHKILYDFREKFEDRRLAEQIPFYWYLHGPFSTVIRNELNSLKLDNTFIEITSSNGHKMYQLQRKIQEPHENNIKDAIPVMEQIIAETDPIHLNTLVKKIYSNAPYKFMPIYKIDYLKSINEYSQFVDNNENERFLSNYIDKIVSYLYRAELNLPDDSFFARYSNNFSNIVGEVNQILHSTQSSNSNIIAEVVKISNSIWGTFAKGLRVKQHDSFYENMVGIWEKEFEESIDIFEINLMSFYETLQERKIYTKGFTTQTVNTGDDILAAIAKGYQGD